MEFAEFISHERCPSVPAAAAQGRCKSRDPRHRTCPAFLSFSLDIEVEVVWKEVESYASLTTLLLAEVQDYPVETSGAAGSNQHHDPTYTSKLGAKLTQSA